MTDTREEQLQAAADAPKWLLALWQEEDSGTARLPMTRGQRDQEATLKALPLWSPQSLPMASSESNLRGLLKEKI